MHSCRLKCGVRPSNVALARPIEEVSCEKRLAVRVFDCLVATGADEYCTYTQHTDLSEKVHNALVRLKRDAFEKFFVLLIHVLARELLVDQLVVVDRRQVLVQLLCNTPLREEFAALLVSGGVIPDQVMLLLFINVVLHACHMIVFWQLNFGFAELYCGYMIVFWQFGWRINRLSPFFGLCVWIFECNYCCFVRFN